jgi:hypothetical protein
MKLPWTLNGHQKNGEITMNINKRYIVDEHGNPKEVVVLLEDYKKIEELLGLDLDDEITKEGRS